MTTWEQVFNLHTKRPQMTAPEMAAVLNCGANYIRKTAQRRGWNLRNGKKILTENERQSIIDAFSDGEKVESLCSEFDITSGSIRRISRKAGLPRRSGGWQSFVR